MPTREWRREHCGECGVEREREWMLDTISKGQRVSAGWTVESRSPEWRNIARPTRWVTMCMCDTYED